METPLELVQTLLSSRPFVQTAQSPPVTPRGSTMPLRPWCSPTAHGPTNAVSPRQHAWSLTASPQSNRACSDWDRCLRSNRPCSAGWDIRSIERVEINEAFAAIAIVVARELGLPEDVVNVEGGAVAHGHPIGATGAVLTTKLIHSMRRDGLRRGLVTLCIGGGQGIALAIEALH